MRNIFILMLLIIGLTLSYAAFAQDAADIITENEVAEAIQNEWTEQDIAEAYFEVFKKVYAWSPVLNNNIKYVSVDLAKIEAINTELLVPMFEEFCKEERLELLQYNQQELIDNGYGDDKKLHETILIGFNNINAKITAKDPSLLGPFAGAEIVDENKLKIMATKSRGGMIGFGTSYQLWEEKNGVWIIVYGGIL